jgi:hypothetical protein
MDYGLSAKGPAISAADERDIFAGLSIQYVGTAHRSSVITVIYSREVPLGEIWVDRNLEVEIGDRLAVKAYVPFPPIPLPTVRNGVSGGSVFLILLMSVGIGYLSMGVMLRFLITGQTGIPNPEFWGGLGELIGIAFSALICKTAEHRGSTLYGRVEADS